MGLPVIFGVRGMAAVLLVLGFVGCSLGRRTDGFRGTWGLTKLYVVTMAVLGLIAFAATLGALVLANGLALALQFFTIFALWLLATLRYVMAGVEYPPPIMRDTHETIGESTRSHR